MITLKIREQLEFNEDVSLIRTGGGGPVLYFNLGYDRVRTFDVATHAYDSIPFPELVEEFLIYSWIMAPDGERSFLFSSDPLEYALELDHRGLIAKKFSVPGDLPTLTNLCWGTPEVHLLDCRGGVWSIQGAALVQPKLGASEEGPVTLYRALVQRFSILKMDHQANGFCAIDRDQNTFGFVSLGSRAVTMAPWSDDMIDISHSRGHLFACRKDGISLFRDGSGEPVLRPKPGRYFCAIETGLVGMQEYLAVLSADETGVARPGSFIDIYEVIPA